MAKPKSGPKKSQEEIDKEWEDLSESDPVMTVSAHGPSYGAHTMARVRTGEVGGEWMIDVSSTSGDDAFEAQVEDLARKTAWHPTDAWRGVYSTPKGVADLVKVVDTWVSPQGHAGDYQTAHQVPIERMLRAWQDGDKPPADVFVVYTTTSNVFSVGFDIYTRKRDENRIRDYLEAKGVGSADMTAPTTARARKPLRE
jgi:hypothetical protein